MNGHENDVLSQCSRSMKQLHGKGHKLAEEPIKVTVREAIEILRSGCVELLTDTITPEKRKRIASALADIHPERNYQLNDALVRDACDVSDTLGRLLIGESRAQAPNKLLEAQLLLQYLTRSE